MNVTASVSFKQILDSMTLNNLQWLLIVFIVHNYSNDNFFSPVKFYRLANTKKHVTYIKKYQK